MKILVIMGSPRKGNTYRAAERIREILRSYGPAEFEYLWLREENLGFCRGCFTCIAKGEESCPVRDSAPAILQKMLDADGVIFASPVYGMNVCGLFKVFIDRFAYIFHRPWFFDKKALLLTTTGAVGASDVLKYLRLTAQIWGFEVAGEAGLITPPGRTRNTGSVRMKKSASGQQHYSMLHLSHHAAKAPVSMTSSSSMPSGDPLGNCGNRPRWTMSTGRHRAGLNRESEATDPERCGSKMIGKHGSLSAGDLKI